MDLDEEMTKPCSGGPSTEPCWWAPLRSNAVRAGHQPCQHRVWLPTHNLIARTTRGSCLQEPPDLRVGRFRRYGRGPFALLVRLASSSPAGRLLPPPIP